MAVTFVYPSLIYVRLNVTVDGSSQKTLAGSSSFSTSSGSYSPRYWPSGNFLFLLSGSAVTLVTSTTNNALMIYYLAIYNTTLSSDDIRNRIKAGVPNSLPIPLAHTAYVQENGEVGDHSNYPEFYQTPIPSSQLAIIALTLYDFDNQPVCPNFANNKLFPPSVMVAVLPKQCLLYREDGSTIDKISPTVSANISTGIVKLRVRPAKNMFSSVHSVAPFCLFSYYAVDGITAQRSLQMANVSVFVTQVDQPPVPVQNLSATAIPHRATHVYLRANSNDKAIIRWIVLSIPMYGKLYTISKSGIVSTAPIKLLSNASSSHSINISTTGLVYIYTGTEDFGMLPSSDSSTGYLTSDYFAFSLVDTVGRESISAFFILSVHTAIQATPTDLTGKGRHDALTTQPLTVQGICSPITLYASDLSTLQRHLTISILQGPTHGRLFYDEACTEDSVTNLSGTILPPYSMGLTVYYLSDSSFFTCPSVSINGTSLNVTLDSFAFQASTTDAQSAVQMQYISVENYNHATEIQLNSSMFEPLVLRAYGAAPIGKESSMAIINGFSIIDPDTDTGFVRVQVSTLKRGGVVSLNKAALDSLDFNSAQHCLGNTRWSCTGSGFEDSVSVFVTYPSAALAALNGMTYLSTKPNILDIVNITIYDGKDGKCLDDSQQSAYSLRDGCFIRSVSFRVTVTGFAETSPVGSSFNSLDGRYVLL